MRHCLIMRYLIALTLVLFGCNTLADGIATPLGLMGSDGTIRQIPPYCGPNAHVENNSKYGALCVQNESTWRVVENTGPRCIDAAVKFKDGYIYACQGGYWKKSSPCTKNIFGKDGEILLCHQGSFVVGRDQESVTTFSELPATGNKLGDVRKVVHTGQRYIWDGAKWLVIKL
jgi:hypothetical protein